MQSTTTAAIDETTEAGCIPILDLCAPPGKITEQLKRSGQLVLTNNEGPVAVMLDVDGSTLEDTMRDLRFLRMRKAIKAIQEASVKNGLSNLTLEEINTEITATRAERKWFIV